MNLTKTSEAVRKIIVAGVILIAIVIVVRGVIIPVGVGIYKSVVPEKDPPNPIYGKLEAPVFVEQKILNSDISFELDTKTGKLPGNAPKKMAVYRFRPSAFSYEAGKDATKTAMVLGFSDTDLLTNLKGDIYAWKNNSLGRELEIQINNKGLELITNTTNRSGSYSSGSFTSEAVAKSGAINLLTSINRFSDSLYKTGEQKVKFGTFSGPRIINTENAREAQVVKVDFYRSVNKVPIYGPNYDRGLISATLGGINSSPLKYINISSKITGINPQSNATYPIVPVSSVWSAIQKNKGVISSVNPEEQSNFEQYRPVRVERVLVSDIGIAYYESKDQQKYLQPIYVFKGFYTSAGSKGSIVIYYPAISTEYIVETPVTQ